MSEAVVQLPSCGLEQVAVDELRLVGIVVVVVPVRVLVVC
jgi:hypothetical protein